MPYNGKDILFSDHGSIFLFRPVTGQAREWVEANITDEETQWLGRAFAVEPRYVMDILQGIQRDGLTFGVDQ